MVNVDQNAGSDDTIVDDTALVDLGWLALTMVLLLTVYGVVDVLSHPPQDTVWRLATSLIPAAVVLVLVLLCRFGRIRSRDAGLITGLGTIVVALSVLYTLVRTGGPNEMVYLNVLVVMVGACAMRRWVFAGSLFVLFLIGLAAVFLTTDPGAVARRDDWLMALVVSIAASLILHRSSVGGLRELGRAKAEIERVAAFDPLTGAASRYGLSLGYPWMVAQATRQESEIFALFADVDGLKAVNDQQGHDSGDLLIQAAATALIRHCRASDLVVRWGGDEFVVIGIGPAPDTNRFENDAAATLRELAAGLGASTGLSVGIASSSQTDGTLEDLVALADEDMLDRRRARGHRSARQAEGDVTTS